MKKSSRKAVLLASCLLPVAAWAGEPYDGGALDASFGTNGRVLIAPNQASSDGTAALDGVAVAVQSTGKLIIAGSDDQGSCFVLRLNANGSIDTSFGGGNGFHPGFAGFNNCTAADVAVLPDDRILLLYDNQASGPPPFANVGGLTGFTANGQFDASLVYAFSAPDGDFLVPTAMHIDGEDSYSLGTIYITGKYNHHDTHLWDVWFAGLTPDRQHFISATYNPSGLGPGDRSAYPTSITEQPSTGNVVIGGYARTPNGDTDCFVLSTVIIPTPPLSSAYPYNGFGTGGVARVGFDRGGDNNDTCNAMSIVEPGDYLAVGGTADTTFVSGSNTYPDQYAAIALLDKTGNIVTWINAQTSQTLDAFSYWRWSGQGANGGVSTFTRIIPYPYGRPVDGDRPGLLLVGYGYHALNNPFSGIDFGVTRTQMPASNSNFISDPTFNHQIPLLYDFGSVSGSVIQNYARSAVLSKGGLVVVGQSTPYGSSASNIAVMRLAPFDGIFRSGFEVPQAY